MWTVIPATENLTAQLRVTHRLLCGHPSAHLCLFNRSRDCELLSYGDSSGFQSSVEGPGGKVQERRGRGLLFGGPWAKLGVPAPPSREGRLKKGRLQIQKAV